jgi:hypothetical protein
LLLGYKPVQHVTVLNTVGNCNTMVSIIILYYTIMAPPSYMRSVVERNVVMRRMTVFVNVGVNPASASAFGLLLSKTLSWAPYLTG